MHSVEMGIHTVMLLLYIHVGGSWSHPPSSDVEIFPQVYAILYERPQSLLNSAWQIW